MMIRWLLVFCVVIQWLGVEPAMNSVEFQVKKPNMTELSMQCLALGRQNVPEAPITFQVQGFCLWFTCTVTAVKNGFQASVKTEGCGSTSARPPCHIRDYDLTLTFPACCPRAVCPGADSSVATPSKIIPYTPHHERRSNVVVETPVSKDDLESGHVAAMSRDQQLQVLALEKQVLKLQLQHQKCQQLQRSLQQMQQQQQQQQQLQQLQQLQQQLQQPQHLQQLLYQLKHQQQQQQQRLQQEQRLQQQQLQQQQEQQQQQQQLFKPFPAFSWFPPLVNQCNPPAPYRSLFLPQQGLVSGHLPSLFVPSPPPARWLDAERGVEDDAEPEVEYDAEAPRALSQASRAD